MLLCISSLVQFVFRFRGKVDSTPIVLYCLTCAATEDKTAEFAVTIKML